MRSIFEVIEKNYEGNEGLFKNYCAILLVIRQKGESQNGCFKNTKGAKFSEKTNISFPLIRTRTCTCAYQGVRNISFSETWFTQRQRVVRFDSHTFIIFTSRFQNWILLYSHRDFKRHYIIVFLLMFLNCWHGFVH